MLKKNKNKIQSPPFLAFAMLNLFTNDWKNSSLIGDLEEEFYNIAEEEGLMRAKYWYMMQALKSLPKLIYDSNLWGTFMFKNYFKIAWRNLLKHKSFSLINISGLAIGMACCLLLSIYINSELSFDAYHEKENRIFRIGEHYSFTDYKGSQSGTNGVIADALKKNLSRSRRNITILQTGGFG